MSELANNDFREKVTKTILYSDFEKNKQNTDLTVDTNGVI